MATLQFLGATGTVTGSKFCLEASGDRVMIDCGLFQGLKELRLRNWAPLPLNPASIRSVVLTHAHIDHCGYLPRLAREGFTGTVCATEATADLLNIMLPDSAKLQEEDADYANRKGFSKHETALPLYTQKDARGVLKRVKRFDYGETVRLGPSVGISFIPAGHILGSGFVAADIRETGTRPTRIVFSGDIGRYDEPILNDPFPVDGADYLLVESTYGNRLHDTRDPKDQLEEIVNSAADRGGKIIIPAFAVGRTQLLVYYLRELEDQGRIPVLPVAVDSPMAASVTRLYTKHSGEHDLDMRLLTKKRRDALSTRNFSLIHGRAESKMLDQQHGPAIIISASGMATGGRVLHHLARHLPDPKTTVVLVGFQAEGTRGRRLQEGETEIKIHGEIIPVNARVVGMSNLSAHADSGEILRWLTGFKRAPRMTFVVHGEPEAAAALRGRIEAELGWPATVPKYQDTVNLE